MLFKFYILFTLLLFNGSIVYFSQETKKTENWILLYTGQKKLSLFNLNTNKETELLNLNIPNKRYEYSYLRIDTVYSDSLKISLRSTFEKFYYYEEYSINLLKENISLLKIIQKSYNIDSVYIAEINYGREQNDTILYSGKRDTSNVYSPIAKWNCYHESKYRNGIKVISISGDLYLQRKGKEKEIFLDFTGKCKYCTTGYFRADISHDADKIVCTYREPVGWLSKKHPCYLMEIDIESKKQNILFEAPVWLPSYSKCNNFILYKQNEEQEWYVYDKKEKKSIKLPKCNKAYWVN